MKPRAMFVGGTASHVGKSWMCTAICRHLRRRGLRVAPFKAQNMSNNSFPCSNGGEIGRAQVVQAEACGLDPEPDMNPVLLKPTSIKGSQVVVNGKVWQNLPADGYYSHTNYLRQEALAAFHRLSARFDYVVLEGAGSVAELNLRDRDFVNLSMAQAASAPALLVADIDRGGVFASVAGTMQLLTPGERAMVKSFAVNRFRGDRSLFSDGVTILEDRSGSRCLGVFPFLEGADVQQEDSVSLDEGQSNPDASLAVIRFPRISNFTDFRLLDASWIQRPVGRDFSWIILPGTKNTIGDLEWLRERGLDRWVIEQHSRGARVLGICGGYQMLGLSIEDPHQLESTVARNAAGLGLLPVRTILEPAKVVRTAQAAALGVSFGAYEIHLGRTTSDAPLPGFATIADGQSDGVVNGNVYGTYLHGALEHRELSVALFGEKAVRHSDADSYDQLADWFERNANMDLFEELYL
jgi:adenosylcobyric acid synthase